MRRDFHIKHRLVRDKLNAALGEAIYTETHWANHLNAVGRPCYTLAMHDRGADHIWEKRKSFQNAQTVCYKRHMDPEAMPREHPERLIEDVGGFAGGNHPFLKEFQTELEKLDNEWEIKRDAPRDENKEPLINQGERMQELSRNIDSLRSSKDWKARSRGNKWKYLDIFRSSYQSRAGALAGTEAGRNSPRKEVRPAERPKERERYREEKSRSYYRRRNKVRNRHLHFHRVQPSRIHRGAPPITKPLRETRREARSTSRRE